MRLRAKVDDNQPEIVRALRKLGCSVLMLHQLGKGCPDILIGFRGKNILAEIKDGSKVPSKRTLTTDEKEFHDMWRGQVAVIESIDDAICLLQK